MPASRQLVPLLFVAASLSAAVVRAADAPPPATGSTPSTGTDGGTPEPVLTAPPLDTHTSLLKPTSTVSPADREALKAEIMAEVKRELEKQKAEMAEEVTYTKDEADARNYDASTLKDLQQSVNLLQIHGYYRLRGDLFNNPSLGRGADPNGYYVFPYTTTPVQGTNTFGYGDMRLRLEPVLRVADWISVHSQIDVLDNVIFGGNPQLEGIGTVGMPPTAGVSAGSNPSIYSSQILASALNVKRVWAQVRLPFGELRFGRMGFHWGEGIFYNDGNCLDCDYGNTFDRVMITSNEVVGHVFSFAWDLLGVGALEDPTTTQSYGLSLPLQQMATSYRFSLTAQKILSDFDRKRKIDNGGWAIQYGLLGAYRMQGYETVENPVPPTSANLNPAPLPYMASIDARFGEADIYFKADRQKLRLSAEAAFVGGQQGNRLFTNPSGYTTAVIGQPINYLQGAAIARARYYLLKQDSLFIGLDLGWASGDKTPGMGIRTGSNVAINNGNTIRGDIDGPKTNCNATSCTNNDVTNFRINPDFRIDELMWRYVFTQISGAYFGRAIVGFKPGGRASGGAEDTGLDLQLSLIYSQAVYASETPSGYNTPLGFEIDAAATFTTKDGLIAGISGGFLVPLSGLDNTLTGASSSFAQVFRGFLGVRF